MILLIIIGPLIFSLAPIFNACMDALMFRFGWSIFKKKNPAFWNEQYISANGIKVKTIGGWKFTGWHVMQSAMIAAVVLALAYELTWGWKYWAIIPYPWLRFLLAFAIYGFEWTGIKPFIYGKIAPKPKNP